MSRVKVHPKSKHHKEYKMSESEKEMGRKGKTVAMGALVVLLIIVIGIFLVVQGR